MVLPDKNLLDENRRRSELGDAGENRIRSLLHLADVALSGVIPRYWRICISSSQWWRSVRPVSYPTTVLVSEIGYRQLHHEYLGIFDARNSSLPSKI